MKRLSFSESQSTDSWLRLLWWVHEQGAVVRITCADNCQCGRAEPYDCKVRSVDGNHLSVREWDRPNSRWIGSAFYCLPEQMFFY